MLLSRNDIALIGTRFYCPGEINGIRSSSYDVKYEVALDVLGDARLRIMQTLYLEKAKFKQSCYFIDYC